MRAAKTVPLEILRQVLRLDPETGDLFWRPRPEHMFCETQSDNCPSNLRDVRPIDNQRNQRRRADSTSGVMGVSLRSDTGKWCAYINVTGSRMHLGNFEDKTMAIAARKEAEKRFDFHQNHGRKAA